MSNVIDFNKPKTTDAGDVGRQIVNSQDPGVRFWSHICGELGGINKQMFCGPLDAPNVCPDCGIDQNGHGHKLRPNQ